MPQKAYQISMRYDSISMIMRSMADAFPVQRELQRSQALSGHWIKCDYRVLSAKDAPFEPVKNAPSRGGAVCFAKGPVRGRCDDKSLKTRELQSTPLIVRNTQVNNRQLAMEGNKRPAIGGSWRGLLRSPRQPLLREFHETQ